MSATLETLLDEQYSTLVEAFVNIVRASAIHTQAQDVAQGKSVPGELTEVLAGRLVEAGTGAQAVLTQLKALVATGDCAALHTANAAAAAAARRRGEALEAQVAVLQRELAALHGVLGGAGGGELPLVFLPPDGGGGDGGEPTAEAGAGALAAADAPAAAQ